MGDDQLEGNMETPLISTPTTAFVSTATTGKLPSLSKPLLILYGFNGVTLAFPILALTYIVNTRVAMPLSDLSIYGALAFCPFSLRPLYAYLSSTYHRHVWITSLLLLNGISTAATALIPDSRNNNMNNNKRAYSNSILLCFLLALIRGITSAWPEFLLGSTLIDQATAAISVNNPSERETQLNEASSRPLLLEQIVARFQSQAATARNMGSLLAHMGVILILCLHQSLRSKKEELNDGLVNAMLVVTGAWNVVAAVVAGVYRVGSPVQCREVSGPNDNNNNNNNDNNQHDNEITDDNRQSTLCRNGNFQERNQRAQEEWEDELLGKCSCCKDRPQSGGDAMFIVALQVGLILLIVRAPLSHWLQPHHDQSSHAQDSTWNVMVVAGVVLVTVCVIVVILALLCLREPFDPKQQLRLQRYRVGIFLVLRHAMPSCSALMSSFFYSMFQATPWVLQLLSLTDMATITLASWLYGRWLAPYSHGWSFMMILTGTTLFSSLAELLFLLITPHHHPNIQNQLLRILVVILVKAIATFSGEWQFLPDVVLATSSAAATEGTLGNQRNINNSDDLSHAPLAEADHLLRRNSFTETAGGDSRDNGLDEFSNQPQLWYGTLISCIDFGGQIGSWMTVPLVAALDITRENDWAHLHVLIGLSSVFGLTTLIFLVLLKPQTKI